MVVVVVAQHTTARHADTAHGMRLFVIISRECTVRSYERKDIISIFSFSDFHL